MSDDDGIDVAEFNRSSNECFRRFITNHPCVFVSALVTTVHMSASHSHTASLLRKPLNEEDASKEMRKITAFILQEASEKAAEIKLRADEEFNMEKAKIFRAEMLSIEENHQRKLKALETKKKM